jgi:hypothetical protein
MEETGWLVKDQEGKIMLRLLEEWINGLIAVAMLALVIYCIAVLYLIHKIEIQSALRHAQGFLFG